MAESIAGLHALGRLGTPADIAALTAVLLSADADWITGQIIGVDGGPLDPPNQELNDTCGAPIR